MKVTIGHSQDNRGANPCQIVIVRMQNRTKVLGMKDAVCQQMYIY